jgi:hypothetical protein
MPKPDGNFKYQMQNVKICRKHDVNLNTITKLP